MLHTSPRDAQKPYQAARCVEELTSALAIPDVPYTVLHAMGDVVRYDVSKHTKGLVQIVDEMVIESAVKMSLRIVQSVYLHGTVFYNCVHHEDGVESTTKKWYQEAALTKIS